ncbi:hypothetical protein H0X06_06260 [Candidatus Dependentiae bacterium]|nr:hypothetical protein [Candidatus Dependentiae bacterium]
MVKKTILPYNLILDLDEVLLHHPSKEITLPHQFFLERPFLVKDTYGYNYIVPAYLPEFLKFARSRFNIAFFSGGDKERNKSVVQDIWKKVFDTNQLEDVPILSREDLTPADRFDELHPKVGNDPFRWYGNYKKDITKVGKLDSTILVDDDKSWVLKGQVPNFLKAPGFIFNLEEFIAKDTAKEGTCHHTPEECLAGKGCELDQLLEFYKLLYITGILDKAAQHDANVIEGLYAIQFDAENQQFENHMKEIAYYKRGYSLLSGFSSEIASRYFPRLEKHFH